jgi:hypothetical protein
MRRVPPLRRPSFRSTVRSTLALAIGAALLVGTAAGAHVRTDDPGNRKEAQILDSLPVVPESEATRVRDRVREYVVTASTAGVIAFYRAQLEALGWQERSVAQDTDQASDIDGRAGEEEDDGTSVVGDGQGSTADGSGSQSGTVGGPTDGQEDADTSSNGPEVSNRGPDDGGVDSGTDPNLAGPLSARFSKGNARLKIVARDVVDADQQTSTNTENAADGSEYRLTVKVR